MWFTHIGANQPKIIPIRAPNITNSVLAEPANGPKAPAIFALSKGF